MILVLILILLFAGSLFYTIHAADATYQKIKTVRVQNQKLNYEVKSMRPEIAGIEKSGGIMDDQVGVLTTSYAALKKELNGRN
jgi:hypothetical protein